jgi:hypothetical protein
VLKDWFDNLKLDGTAAMIEGRDALARTLESELNQLRRRLAIAFQELPRVEDRLGE